MSDSPPSPQEIELRKLRNDEERLQIERSFARTWAPAAGAIIIPLAIGAATATLSYQQNHSAAEDNRIKQGLLCVDYFIRFDTDPNYLKLDPAGRTAILKNLQQTFTSFPQCLQLHKQSIQEAYLSGGGANSTISQDARLSELNKIFSEITAILPRPAPGAAVPLPAGVQTPAPPPAVPAAGLQPATAPPPIDRAAYRIYLQYRNDTDRANAQAIADALAVKGWQVTRIQHVVQATKGDVRYYKAEEKAAAEVLASDVAASVAAIPGLPPVHLTPIDISRTFPNLPGEIMEIWLAEL